MISQPIDQPRRGDYMRASWGARVAERVNECADAIDGLRGPAALSSVRDPASAGVAPFAVRYDGENERWIVYLPYGCMNVGGTCHPINPQVTQRPGWHLLALDESQGTAGEDADGNTYREWTVTAHAKTSAKIYGVDNLNAPTRRLLFVGAEDLLNTDPTDAERYRDTPGDSFSCAVARIRVTVVVADGESRVVRNVTQLRTTPVDVGDVRAPTGFDLVWYFSSASGALTVETVYCMRQLLSVAGMSVTGNQMTDVTDAEWIYARIDTADMSDGRGIASVVADPGNDVYSSGNLITWLALYRLKENSVTDDYRENSLKNVQLYRE